MSLLRRGMATATTFPQRITGSMDTNARLEQRITALEQEVAKLKRQLGIEDRNWLDNLFGTMSDIPEEDFQEFVRLCKEARDAQTDPE